MSYIQDWCNKNNWKGCNILEINCFYILLKFYFRYVYARIRYINYSSALYGLFRNFNWHEWILTWLKLSFIIFPNILLYFYSLIRTRFGNRICCPSRTKQQLSTACITAQCEVLLSKKKHSVAVIRSITTLNIISDTLWFSKKNNNWAAPLTR